MTKLETVEKALEKIAELLSESVARACIPHLTRIQEINGANSLFERIVCAADKETLYDYFAEVRYALVFAGLAFEIEIEPSGKKGPDLRVSRDNHSSVVEITRFRPIYPGPQLLDHDTDILLEYGNIKRDTRKAISKIYKKFSQISDTEAIIAIWNDDGDMEEIEVEQAIKDLINESTLPPELAFVIYGSEWIHRRQQLFCFPLHDTLQPHQRAWKNELESSTISNLIKRNLGSK